MDAFLFKEKTYTIIGLCMEVHRILAHGFSEIVYKDAIMVEANLKDIEIERERRNLKLCTNKISCSILFLPILYFTMI